MAPRRSVARHFAAEFLGAAYGTPLNLRQHEIVPHLQDPSSEWRYALGRETATALRAPAEPPSEDGCVPNALRRTLAHDHLREIVGGP